MKLWLITAIEGRPEWRWEYDRFFGFVVRAETEEAARLLASANPGDEGANAWMDPNASTCVELTTDGLEGIVLSDFNAG